MRRTAKNILLLLYAFAGKISFAQQNAIDSLQHVLQVTTNDTVRLNTMVKLGSAYFLKGRYRDALKDAENTRKFYLGSKSRNLYPRVFNVQFAYACVTSGNAFTYMGVYDSARFFLDSALRFSTRIGDEHGKADALSAQGIVYWYLGKFTEAIGAQENSLAIRTALKDKKGIGACHTNIGLVYYSMGTYPRALDHYYIALKIQEELHNDRSVANIYNNIGNIYYNEKNFEGALENFRKVLAVRIRLEDKYGEATTHNNIGLVYFDMNKPDSALTEQLAGLKLRQEIGDKIGIASSYSNIGGIYIAKKNYKAAMENYKLALDLREEAGDAWGILASFNNMGQLYSAMEQFGEAEKWFNKGLKLSVIQKSKSDIRDSYEGLSGLFERKALHTNADPDWKKAVEYYKLFISWRDSLVNEENTKKSVQSQMQYDFDKKEAQAKAEQEKKDAIAAADARKQKIILWAVAGGLLLVLAFAVFIYRSYLQKQRANEEISLQKQVIEEKQKEILDSIHYARRIQRSRMPSEKFVERSLRKLKRDDFAC